MALPIATALTIMSEASGIEKLPANITMTAMLKIIDLAFAYGQESKIECQHDFNYGDNRTDAFCIHCGKTIAEIQ